MSQLGDIPGLRDTRIECLKLLSPRFHELFGVFGYDRKVHIFFLQLSLPTTMQYVWMPQNCYRIYSTTVEGTEIVLHSLVDMVVLCQSESLFRLSQLVEFGILSFVTTNAIYDCNSGYFVLLLSWMKK